MNLLVLGGTRFAGSFLVEMALSRGHDVTLYNRGRTAPDRFPEVELLTGERDPREGPGLDALVGRRWDAVLDFCGYVPRVVRAGIEALGSNGRYTFISSCSAFSEVSAPGVDESGTLAEPPPFDVEEITGETYGGLKVACEREAQTAYGDRAWIVRPGLIVGPRDPTDRFTWWPVRIAAGGTTLAPAPRDQLVQGIDARDLAAFLLDGVEAGRSGAHNAVGDPVTLEQLVELCQSAAGPGAAEVVWMDGPWLEAQDVEPWTQVPMWVGSDPSDAGFNAFANTAARAAGLELRPMAQTVKDTLAWFEGGRDALKTGLSPEREAELIAAWGRS